LPPTPADHWPEPAAYWAHPLDPDACREAAAKYGRLGTIARWPDGPARTRALRAAALQWPGSLRECQIVAPDDYAARGTRAELGARSPAVPREQWRAEGWGAVPLWLDLSALFRDLARLRGPDLAAALDRLDPVRRGFWPRDVAGWPAERCRASARLAEAWLAAAVGLTPAELALALRAPAPAW